MTGKRAQRPSSNVVALHSIGPTGKPRFDGSIFGSVLVALIEAARFYAWDDRCATLDVLAVAGRFADNIARGLEQRHCSMSVEDLTLAMAMLRRTSETILREPIGAGDDDPTVVDYARAETLAAAATSIEGMLEYAR